MKVYLIPGLAADSRVFHRIRLPEGHEAIPLDWIRPLPGESLPDYAGRLGESIVPNTPFALIGLSFGGMVATEIARRKAPSRLVLLSSIPTPTHLPPYFRHAGSLRLDQKVPVGLLKKGIVWRRMLEWNANEDRALITDIVRKSDPAMIRWSMRAILEWKADPPPGPYVQIHGSRDIVLPLRYTRPTHVVSGAGHLMVMDRAPFINDILKEIFN